MMEAAAVAIAIWASLVLDGWLLWATCGLGWTLLPLALIDQKTHFFSDILTVPRIRPV